VANDEQTRADPLREQKLVNTASERNLMDAASIDGLNAKLDAMHLLLQYAVTHKAAGRSAEAFTTTSDPTFAQDTLMEVLAAATSTISAVLPREPRPAEVVLEGLERQAGNWPASIRVRVLACNAGVSRERLLSYAAGKNWLEVRLTAARVPSTVAVDGICAIVRVTRPDGVWQATMVRDEAIIAAVDAMCVNGWLTGVPISAEAASDGLVSRETMLQITGYLAEGRIDEIAAREMSISVRTYRRYVAEVMRCLGATSRFQAGVRAAELGLTGRRVLLDAPSGSARRAVGRSP